MDEDDSLATRFADLTPVEQDDGPVPVVRIAYSHSFKIVMGYFRRILVNGEHSKRALDLAAEVIDHNAANYTAWQFRRKCIKEMTKQATEEERKAAWKGELQYCTEQCEQNMKNYQVWFHRRACVGEINSGQYAELDFVASVLREDSKNYHAWGHRQWVIKHFNLWSQELQYVDCLLDDDVRNNSAWNQRYYVHKNTTGVSSVDLVASEVAYALKHIARATSNPSPWAYLKGLVEPLGYDKFPQVRQACERLCAESMAAGSACLPAQAMMVDILQASGQLLKAAEVCAQLASQDTIRERYWHWRKARALAASSAATATAPPQEVS